MSYTRVNLIYFSPTQTTQKTLEAIAEGTGVQRAHTVNLTTSLPSDPPVFSSNDLVLVGMPVYGGRLPALAVERLKSIFGKGASVVPVVVYGNRHYDDALVELYDLCREQGFGPVVAAGAFLGEHSFSTPELPLSPGRPDAADLDKAKTFGQQIGTTELSPEQIPGQRPYKAAMNPTGSATSVDPAVCTQCGKCIKACPTQGMSLTDSAAEADSENCIWCLACLRVCPTGARSLTHDKVKASAQKLNDLFSERREPETVMV